ncbi:prealbumin-like fold domain-containing protein [Mumia sp. DW29H23]|uniref:prealbumin-like fold domain-containing protein n=1 Tax=Mumia sp. DW29H23 TaxID=3421241 RepID=UPI003D69F1E1
MPASGTVTSDSGFEAADGNLAVNSTFDWNGFAPTVWTGTAPYRTTQKTVASGWALTGLEDAQATTSDTAFAGGVKQDDDCAVVGAGKAPNKDDLKRIYVGSNTVGGDIFLTLAWARIKQNTTSPSAHVGFEFNQGETACGGSSDGLVRRTAGDMLIVYDFEGGSADTPRLTLRRWVTSGSCEVGSSAPPCWGPATDLTALGFAEARVNTSLVGPVSDQIAPSPETLGVNEFGEAGINLTDAGVFTGSECVAFGSAFGVSRSSGNSAQAQMKDLVGPGEINITNCGRVVIRKATDPSPDPTDSTFTYATTGGLSPSTFSLKDGDAQDYGGEVFAGQYTVTEDDPGPTFDLDEVTCEASDTTHGTTIQINGATVSFDLKPLDTVDCTYVNDLRTGAIEITKTRKHAADGPGDHPHAGVDFAVTGTGVDTTVTTGADGTACVDGLLFGDYTVTEDTPAGYAANAPQGVTVSAVSTCGDGNEVAVSFHNTPLTDVTVSVDSQVVGGTASSIVCTDADGNVVSGTTGAGGDGSVTVGDLPPTDPSVTLTCEVTVDP